MSFHCSQIVIGQDSTLPAHPLGDPRIEAFVEDIAQSIKYSLAMAASGAELLAPGELDRAFQAAFATLPAESRAAIASRAREYLNAPAVTRTHVFGRYGRIEQAAYARVGSNGVQQLAGEVRLPLTLAEEPAARLALQGLNLPTGTGQTPQAGTATLSKLQVHIDSVYCYGESHEAGVNRSDEIVMAAVAVLPNGDTKKVNKFTVSSDFDTGETATLNKLLIELDLNSAPNLWPKEFGLVLSMAEEDYGGFSDVIDQVASAVSSEVKKKVTAAISTGLAAALGAAIGQAIGAIVAAIIAAVVQYLVKLAHDDVFPSKQLTFSVHSTSADILQKQGYVPGTKFNVDFVMKGTFHTSWYRVRCRALCK